MKYILILLMLITFSCKEHLKTEKEIILVDTTKVVLQADTAKTVYVAPQPTKTVYVKPHTHTRTVYRDRAVYRDRDYSNGTQSQAQAPVYRKRGWSHAAKGAVIGGVGGAVVGGVIKGGKGAVVGGVVGAAGGYIIGRKKDKENR